MKQALEWLNEVGETVAQAMFCGGNPPGENVCALIRKIQVDARADLLMGLEKTKLPPVGDVVIRERRKPEMIDGFPRRSRIDLYTPAEKAISNAVQAVEMAGCHTWLTDAVTLLQQAKDRVADFVELTPVHEAEPPGLYDAPPHE